MMFVSAIVEFFKYKIVGSVIVLACWSDVDRMKFTRNLNRHGLRAAFTCDSNLFNSVPNNLLQGVIYIKETNDTLLQKVKLEHFSIWYKWLMIGDDVPESLHRIRYDADVTLLKLQPNILKSFENNAKENETIYFEDIYVHSRDGVSLHPWAIRTNSDGFKLTNERERILRRLDLKKSPLRIATPVGHFSEDFYDGSFAEYLVDNTIPEHDSIIRCSYGAATLIVERLNAEKVLIPTLLWSTEVHNNSMFLMVASGTSDLNGAILRPLHERIKRLDYIMPLWPFSVGFTYLAERESSNNMFVEPFTTGVWLACFGIGIILALAQRITSKTEMEKEGAFMAVLATWLQQDASAVPDSMSGRWTFMVLSVASMLVHAYYTSAIVSSLMSAGRSGPDSLRALADSRYAIASEDYDYMRFQMFDIQTNWTDLEYLKKKKLTPNFYQNIERGVKLIQEGNTAFHTEYNQIYQHLKTFSDEHLCKLQYVDTIPETLSWIVSTKRGQWSEVFRSSGGWIHEIGLIKRLLNHWQFRPPPCRAALLAERVKFGDVASVLGLTAAVSVMSFVLLGIEIGFAKWGKKRRVVSASSDVTMLSLRDYIE